MDCFAVARNDNRGVFVLLREKIASFLAMTIWMFWLNSERKLLRKIAVTHTDKFVKPIGLFLSLRMEQSGMKQSKLYISKLPRPVIASGMK